jgi:hypothetical protein
MIELRYRRTPKGHKIAMSFSSNNRMPAIIDRDPAHGGEAAHSRASLP